MWLFKLPLIHKSNLLNGFNELKTAVGDHVVVGRWCLFAPFEIFDGPFWFPTVSPNNWFLCCIHAFNCMGEKGEEVFFLTAS